MTGTIYNTTDGPLPYDRAGRMLAAREHVDVDDLSASPVAGHVAAGRFIVTSEDDEQAQAADPVEPASADDSASQESPEPEPQTSAKRRRGGSQTPAPSTQEA